MMPLAIITITAKMPGRAESGAHEPDERKPTGGFGRHYYFISARPEYFLLRPHRLPSMKQGPWAFMGEATEVAARRSITLTMPFFRRKLK